MFAQFVPQSHGIAARRERAQLRWLRRRPQDLRDAERGVPRAAIWTRENRVRRHFDLRQAFHGGLQFLVAVGGQAAVAIAEVLAAHFRRRVSKQINLHDAFLALRTRPVPAAGGAESVSPINARVRRRRFSNTASASPLASITLNP